jgi:hypothetical protein
MSEEADAAGAGAVSPTPSFRELSPEILATLRATPAVFPVAAWAEKLLRYCEIFQPDLRRRAREKWGSAHDTAQRMGELAQFFFDYYESTRDLRFLNIVLKLADARWIAIPDALREKIAEEPWE